MNYKRSQFHEKEQPKQEQFPGLGFLSQIQLQIKCLPMTLYSDHGHYVLFYF